MGGFRFDAQQGGWRLTGGVSRARLWKSWRRRLLCICRFPRVFPLLCRSEEVVSVDEIDVEKKETYINEIGISDDGLAIFVFGGHVVTTAKGRWPMHEVKVEIVGIEVFQRSVTGFLYIFWMMRVVPQFCGNEDFFSRDTTFLDASGARGLCAIASEQSA